jgi:hypothetical protein
VESLDSVEEPARRSPALLRRCLQLRARVRCTRSQPRSLAPGAACINVRSAFHKDLLTSYYTYAQSRVEFDKPHILYLASPRFLTRSLDTPSRPRSQSSRSRRPTARPQLPQLACGRRAPLRTVDQRSQDNRNADSSRQTPPRPALVTHHRASWTPSRGAPTCREGRRVADAGRVSRPFALDPLESAFGNLNASTVRLPHPPESE